MTLLEMPALRICEAYLVVSAIMLCQYASLVQEAVGVCFAGASVIQNIFSKDVLALFALGWFGWYWISVGLLRCEMSDARDNLMVRKVGVRYPGWFFSAVGGALTYVAAIHWPQLIAVGVLLLAFVALLLYGQIYFRRANRRWLLWKKRRLEKFGKDLKSELSALAKVDKDFKADMNRLEKGWFRYDVVSDYTAKLKEKIQWVESCLAKLEMLGV